MSGEAPPVLLDTGRCNYLGGYRGLPLAAPTGWEFPVSVLVTTEGLYIFDQHRKREGNLLASIALSEIVTVEAEEFTPDHARGWSVGTGFLGSGSRVKQTSAVAFTLASGDRVTFLANMPLAQVKHTLGQLHGYLSGRQTSVVAAQPTDVVTALERLAELRDRGVLTPEEFAAQKAKLLG